MIKICNANPITFCANKKTPNTPIPHQLGFNDKGDIFEYSNPWEEKLTRIDEYLDTKGSFLIKHGSNPLREAEYAQKRSKNLEMLARRTDSTADLWLLRILERSELNDDNSFKINLINTLTSKQIPKQNSKQFYTRAGNILDTLSNEITKESPEQLTDIIKNGKKGWLYIKSITLSGIESFIDRNNYKNKSEINRMNKSFQKYLDAITSIKKNLNKESHEPIESILSGFIKRLNFK